MYVRRASRLKLCVLRLRVENILWIVPSRIFRNFLVWNTLIIVSKETVKVVFFEVENSIFASNHVRATEPNENDWWRHELYTIRNLGSFIWRCLYLHSLKLCRKFCSEEIETVANSDEEDAGGYFVFSGDFAP